MAWAGALLWGLLAGGQSRAQNSIPISAPEYRLKAAMLIGLSAFVDWPNDTFKSPTEPVQVGVLGKDPFGVEIDDAAKSKKRDGRPFRVRRSIGVKELAGCQIVFIPKSESKNLTSILPDLRKPGVLLVGESDQFCEQGGMVNLLVKDGQTVIEIHLGNARAAGFDISGNLANNPHIHWVDRGKK